MYIKSLELKDFRNYESLNLNLKKGVNIFYGNNAQGKTNILEAAYMCLTSKSNRTAIDKEIIKKGAEDAHVKLILMKDEVPVRIDLHLKNSKKKGMAINTVPIKKIAELLGVGNVVFFTPNDLDIIKNGPIERRKFIDNELSQLDKIYLYNLVSYQKVLSERNKLLKDPRIEHDKSLMDTLDIWDEQLVKYGTEVIKIRESFVNELNEIVYNIHKNLTSGKENISISYEKNVTEEAFKNKLSYDRRKDLYVKSTSCGPHKDDLCIKEGDMDLRKFGSRGQMRTAALSLKFAEIEFIRRKINDTPILMLDDVLSELDSERQKKLLENISNLQTIITCTGLDEFIENRIDIENIFKVENGNVTEIGNGGQNGQQSE